MTSLVLTDSSQLTSDSQHLGIYSSPMTSLVLTDSSQLTSDSQHLDISGVLKDGGSVIPGSLEAFHKLQNSGLPVKLVTNETQETKRSLALSLSSLGYDVNERDILPPCPAVVKLLKEQGLRPHLLVHPNVLGEFQELDQSNPNCVVIGDASDNFTYKNLNTAFKILINMPKPRLFTLGRGRYYREQSGLLVLDVGVFTAALEYAADVKAEVIGKPQPDFFHSAILEMGIKPEEVVMVGDDVVSDIGGAQSCGLKGVLVRTGKFRPSDECHPYVQPDAIVDDLAGAVQLILDTRNNYSFS
uniref:Phospholysine phosphohistidine inorganic pyrophosphate phosphatase n=1 Tax=Timema californicum TaxID=61474 RepID=A0A7R9JDE1_TIMCA|nr:unnamed protein product [Timema californicum]